MTNHNSQAVNMAVKWVISLLRVQDVLGLNLNPNITYRNFFFVFSQVCPGKGRGRFLPHPCQLVINHYAAIQ
jgi:hypothetical protein